MCGIAGIWQLDGERIELTTAQRFIGALAHRGPDGEGVLIEDEGGLALAHRRLTILDPSAAGDQPMLSPSGRYVITHNGEIYNFRELRAELERKGFRFRSDTDTEVILAAYEQWGPDCLLRFNGMWSFAIWDRRQRSLFVARDRFGVKPLYVLVSYRRFAFASELKAFLHLDGFSPSVDTRTLAARLVENFSEGVLLRAIELVPPGHWFEVTPEYVRRQRWWNTIDHLVLVPPNLATQAEEFRELLFDACRLRLHCDVPKATSLSGGLDSSSVLSSVAAVQQGSCGAGRQASEAQRAFIARFPDTPQDETAHALLAAEHAGAVPVVRSLSGYDLRAHVDAYLYQFEEIGGLFGMAAWALYRQMRREGVVVSLDGHGGDELLGGYATHIEQALLRSPGFAAAPCRTLDLIDTLHHMCDPAQPNRTPNKALLAALTIPIIRSVARRIPVAWPGQQGLAGMLQQHANPIVVRDTAARDEEKAIDALGPLTGELYRSFHRHLLPRILRNFDVHSMGHGVEVRMPLLDWRVVRYAFSVPDESKAAGGYTKRLLREAMRGLMPEAIRLRRHKIGFNAPVAHWLAGGLEDWLWDELNEQEFLRSELWNARGLLAFASAKRRSGSPWHPAEAHQVALAVTAHWWQTRWLRSANSRSGQLRH